MPGTWPATTPKTQVRELFVDTRDIDPVYNPFDFTIHFNSDTRTNLGEPALHGVTRLVLVQTNIPKVANEDYVVITLSVPSNNLLTSDTHSPSPTLVHFFDSGSMTTGSTKAIIYPHEFKFQQPIALARLSIKVSKHGGSTVTAADTAGVTTSTYAFQIHHN